MKKERIFLSLDVEADGPAPSVNNCLQIAIVACRYDPDPDPSNVNTWVVSTIDLCLDPQDNRKECQLTMTEFWSRFPDVLARIRTNAQDPTIQMKKLSDWLTELEEDYVITQWVAAPAAYDWQWVNSVYHQYLPIPVPYQLPYSCECMSSIRRAVGHMTSSPDEPKMFMSVGTEHLPHTHYALEDALEQAYKYLRLCKFM
uniref:Uncharacterized protein n=1 Tax=Marseillevirus LCMAC201 TaxID=2506605 RepID=A0A481YY60_9VIRU|nr:MAG: hypothetical protein LCMAC201_03940 [Marseillevirus LCMAC201]